MRSTARAIGNDGPQPGVDRLYRILYIHATVVSLRRRYLTLTVTGSVRLLGALAIAMGNNSHVGSSFASWLDETGPREAATLAAVKHVIARQLADEMKKKNWSRTRMAKLMKTSRTQIARLLDPENGNITIGSLQRAARIVGRELRMELV